MKRGNTPDTPEAVLAELLPFLLHAYRIFDEAVPEATLEEFTSKGDEVIEPIHHSSATRIRAKRRFISNKPSEMDYTVGDLLNNGLEFVYNGRVIKFLKGRDGQPPPCGKSRQRRAFYQHTLFGKSYEQEIAKELVVIYNVTRDGVFLGLDLACTKGVISDYEAPELHWSIPVPHPATVQATGNPYESQPDDLDEEIKRDDEDEGDLDISLDGTDE